MIQIILRLDKITAIFLIHSLLPTCFDINAQNWQPIPFEQTSYFHNPHLGHVLPLKNDSALFDSTGILALMYHKRLHDELGPCFDDLGDGYTPMIRGFEIRNDTIRILGKCGNFFLLTSATTGELLPFTGSLLSRLDSTRWASFLGIEDSVKYWSILFPDSTSVKASIALSKNHGFIKIPDCELMIKSQYYLVDALHYALIGLHDSLLQTGFQQPLEKVLYYPYAPGDKLFYYYDDRKNLYTSDYTYVEEYRYIKVDSVIMDNGQPVVKGKISRFNVKDRSVISRDGNTQMKWRVTVTGDYDYTYPYQLPNIAWYKSNLKILDSEFILETHSSEYDSVICDWFIDGPSYSSRYSSFFGKLEESLNAGYQGYSSTKLLAAKMSGRTYGIWPDWLGSDEIERAGIEVYPNPASNLVRIGLNTYERSEVRLFSSEGSLVATGEVVNGRGELDVSALPSGIYVVCISNSKTAFSRSLAVKH